MNKLQEIKFTSHPAFKKDSTLTLFNKDVEALNLPQFVFLVGENGCGKTSILDLIYITLGETKKGYGIPVESKALEAEISILCGKENVKMKINVEDDRIRSDKHPDNLKVIYNKVDVSFKKPKVTSATAITVDEKENPKKEVVDPDFAKDKERFCLSDKAGQEFIQSYEQMKRMGDFVDKMKEKEKNKDLYDAVANLKKLKIVELQELLTPILEKAGYIKLQFKDPELTKDVFVPFIVYEQKPDREDRASTYELEKLLRKTLKDTNCEW